MLRNSDFLVMIIRSVLFWGLVFLISILAAVLFFPVLIIPGVWGADFVGRHWSRTVLFLLKYIGGIDYEVIDLDKLPKGPFIIACKHQSMWETVVMGVIFFVCSSSF